MRVPIDKVPLEVRRRAANALAGVSDRHLMPGRDGVGDLGFDQATPIYRPDLDDIAYWEIEVMGVTTALPIVDAEPKQPDRGFIIVSTGAHDVPIPHFSLDLAPPSHQLEQFGEATRVVKLDALCYAAESGDGTLLGHIGAMPPKLSGVPANLPRQLPQGWATTLAAKGSPWSSYTQNEDGAGTPKVRRRSSKEARPVAMESWRSWNEVTSGYAAAFRLHLDTLAQRAAPRWAAETLIDTYGEGILSGDTLTVLMLEEGELTIDGPAKDLASAELNPQPLPPRIRLTATAGVDVKDTSFDVHLSYRSGVQETLHFFIVPTDAPSLVGRSTAVFPEGI